MPKELKLSRKKLASRRANAKRGGRPRAEVTTRPRNITVPESFVQQWDAMNIRSRVRPFAQQSLDVLYSQHPTLDPDCSEYDRREARKTLAQHFGDETSIRLVERWTGPKKDLKIALPDRDWNRLKHVAEVAVLSVSQALLLVLASYESTFWPKAE